MFSNGFVMIVHHSTLPRLSVENSMMVVVFHFHFEHKYNC